MELIKEEQLKHGALVEDRDERDYCYEALGTRPLTDEDWAKGFSIEKEVGYTIPVKNQFNSYSCVGQAYAYYLAVLKSITNKTEYKEVSAKSIYSLIALTFSNGAYLRDGAKSITEVGAMWEEALISYTEFGISNEPWMRDKSWFTEDVKDIMALLRTQDYFRVTTYTIDGFAKAIRDGHGMVAGVEGVNNGTWKTSEPKPPTLETPEGQIWGHAIYFIGYGIDEKGKYIEVINSWGKDCGDNGKQKLREDWFKMYENGRVFLFAPWLLIDKNKIMTNDTAKILKDKNSSAVGIWLPAISEAVLKSYALNMGKVLPLKADGSIDWDKSIDGEFEYKN